MPSRPFLSLLLTSLFLSFTAFPTPAQTGDPADDVFGDVVDVRVVNLEVVVEQKGVRVEGLDASDFELTVDGRTVDIEFFTEVRDGWALAPTSRSAATVPALPPGEALGTQFLVFVDDVFTLPHQRDRVLRRLADETHLLGPADRMAVVAYDGRQVDMLTSWTGSGAELERAFDAATDRPTRGLFLRQQQRFQDTHALYHQARFGPPSFAHMRGYDPRGGLAWAELVGVVDAASASLRAFAQPEGRKVLLLVSGGWASSIFDDRGESANVDYSTDRSQRQMFDPLIDTANRLGYTLYPVDAQWQQYAYGDASVGSLREAQVRNYLRREREWSNETALLEIADETGGRALLGGAGTPVLEKVKDDTRSYYWIGFTPDWQGDDRRHRVRVDVPGVKRAKVRSRESFSDLSPSTVVTMQMEGAQLLDLPLPSAARLAVSTGQTSDAGWNRTLLPIRVEFPLDHVTLVPRNGGYSGLVELRVAVTDDRGDRADIPVVPIRVDRDEPPRPGETGAYEMQLRLRDRPHKLLFSLVDTASGTLLSERVLVDL